MSHSIINSSTIKDHLCKLITESTANFLVICDESGNIIESNIAAQEIVSRSITDMNITDIFTSDIKLDDYLSSGRKHLLTLKSGSANAVSMYFSFHKISNSIAVFGEIDLQDSRNFEKCLIETNRELANVSRQLNKSNAQLKKLNDLKNSFLGMAAHDLRNPIGAIRIFSELLLKDAAKKSLDSDFIYKLNTIGSQCDFMLRLLNDLLDFSVIESGKMQLKMEDVNPAEFIEYVASLSKLGADKKNITLKVNLPESVKNISFDSQKIQQVLINLITNALKFSYSETTITISLEETNDGIVFSVSDQGQGIPQEELGCIFEAFKKASVKNTSGEKSTGLGLAIAQKIVLAHKGKMWVESKVGQGSTFFVFLPN
ncbi:Alkaline phosphatase synthesis sensor protein PhoR [Limihaloglobus sulfuriphilus]|uniref:histidine kinase n=1 Tax=Limihaloglobus sulfuriphilus TaxID=1851148 RepID=A0A1Q2MDD0_9BACT|nr:HAMP domain-containing sensor histidine kinase [Limihaloglobus sulfuriphilus]AQQ70680.1 Alkaline phosphatase synthesis sensor protein PhoR [Limihaloglobus sulfuriphilus]